MLRPWLLTFLLLRTVVKISSYSTGAPAAACARIYPEGHGGTSQNFVSSPYALDISSLYHQSGNIYYTPGGTYTRTYVAAMQKGQAYSICTCRGMNHPPRRPRTFFLHAHTEARPLPPPPPPYRPPPNR